MADSPYSIPSNSNLEALNLLIKGILKEDQSVEEDDTLDELVEFDFYINSKPVLTTLEEFVNSNDEVKVVRFDDRKLYFNVLKNDAIHFIYAPIKRNLS